MLFKSTDSDEVSVSFRDAILSCLPPEGGLYVPSSIVDMRQFFLYMDENTSFPELVSAIAPVLLQGELNPLSADRVAESAFDFEPEVQVLDEQFSVLKLYNGPTGVFKDFGIAFLAAIMEELLKNSGRAMVISAARGDTGVSIAHAFSKRQNITSVILYPSGQIRGLDEATFVQNGGNIIPIQVKGTFDDCQRLINEAINDRGFAERYSITAGNAINVGRLLPQAFYYLYAFIKVKKLVVGDLLFSVPCGNFGNLIAGLYAWKFGMPVNGFIAAMNANDSCGDFFAGRGFNPKALIATNSPALDVSFPSNYKRLASFYEESPAVMRHMVYTNAGDDSATTAAMEKAWKRYGILLDPHGAVAFAAADKLASSAGLREHFHTVILATGHPAKEPSLISKVSGEKIEIPTKLAMLKRRSDPVAVIPPQIDALESAIASCL
jgi:threonine synthase